MSSSVHISALLRQIRSLPFEDMVMLAEYVRLELLKRKDSDLDAYIVAHALLSISAAEPTVSDQTKNEEKVLKKIFSRKRTISITQRNGGWVCDISTLKAASVMGTELRATLGQLLDTAVTVHILTEK